MRSTDGSHKNSCCVTATAPYIHRNAWRSISVFVRTGWMEVFVAELRPVVLVQDVAIETRETFLEPGVPTAELILNSEAAI